MLSLYEILQASKTGIAPDTWTALAGANFGGAGSGAETKELTGIPPLSIRSNSTMLLDYLISGNMSQTGAPTPSSPIMPQETGERTGNLFNVNRLPRDTWTIDDKYYIDGAVGDSKSSIRPDTVDVSISNSGDLTVTARSYYGAGFVIPVTPNTTYTISFTTDTAVPSSKSLATITYVNADEDFLNYIMIYGGTTSTTFTTPNTAYYILITFRYTSNTITYSDIMLSSTPLPYEPYGYKIPISSGGVNLFDKDNADIVDLYPETTTREIKQSSNLSTWSIILPVEPSTTYTFTMGEATTAIRRRVGMCSDYPTKGAYCTSVDDTPEYDHPNLGNIFTTDADTRYVLIMYVSGAGRNVAIERANQVQVVKGNTALPYEPYVQPTLSNIYLGEVETTRKIRKYECTGDESWSVTSGQGKTRAVANFTTSIGIVPLSKVVSTHYIGVEGGAGYPDINTITVNNNGTMIIGISSEYTDANAFKAYITQQYENGTPVTIWYVLATETTGIVNEPLRKIGNYVDTLSMEQAGVQIPTNRGNTVIDVETTLKPSEMYIKYQE